MSELRLNTDGHIIKLGADNDVTLTHVADTGILLNSTMQLQFNDASQNINAPSATVLDINATDEIELNATAVDLNGTLDVSGTLTQTGVATFSARSVHSSGITIADAGQIGSASDADSIAIASNGVVTFTQAPVFPDGSLAVADLDIDGATDIGAAVVDADLFIIDDGAGGTNRKVTASRIKTYAGGAVTAINNATANELVTIGSTTTELDAEANLTFDGTDLAIGNGDLWCKSASSTVSVGAAVDDGYLLGSANDDVKLIGKTGSGLMRGSSSAELWWDGTQFYPGADDSYHLGHSSYRFDNIHATNGTIQTSDENLKENIADSSLGLNFINKLRPVQFTWKDKAIPERLYKESDKIPDGKKVGDVWREAKTITHSRRHYGLIAQEVEKVLSDNGIDTENFAPFIKTKVQTLDEGTHKFTETSNYTYGMRYNELVGILIKSIQELSTKVKTLEDA